MPGDGASLASGFGALLRNRDGASLGRFGAGVAVKRVTIRTQFSPAFTLEPGYGGEGPDGEPLPPSGFSFGALLRPSITVEGPLGDVHYAPYGEPTENYLPYMLGGAAVVFAAGSLFCGAMQVAKYAALGGLGLAAAGYLRNKLGASASVSASS